MVIMFWDTNMVIVLLLFWCSQHPDLPCHNCTIPYGFDPIQYIRRIFHSSQGKLPNHSITMLQYGFLILSYLQLLISSTLISPESCAYPLVALHARLLPTRSWPTARPKARRQKGSPKQRQPRRRSIPEIFWVILQGPLWISVVRRCVLRVAVHMCHRR